VNPNLQEEELFEAAREFSSPGQLSSFLDKSCAGNPRLRARIESLLAVHREAEKFFAAPPSIVAPIAQEVSQAAEGGEVNADRLGGLETKLTEGPGTRIGRYKLLQQIGEGGCGVVYMAEQEEPVRRQVALKIIKLGMDTKNVIARFEAERQALALMDHPNIARVFDGGATENGRPFFVMELVHGIRITDFCDQRSFDTRQRLDLFIQICHAIQHAHQKGIIHRDIKPSNVLVTVRDGVPVPKVIDFGIAKATEGRLTNKTYFTPYQQFIGTPAYMSPEQAERSDLDIDTRSDIYSLGVLLYELLTGKTPFDTNKLLKAGLSEMRRTLRETEPHRPSTMVTTLQGNELTMTALHRHEESPPKLISQLQGDLDWIVMKALEKDRRRRYETANGLAMDVQRHLNNEPVMARPPSRLYQFQKLVRRNRAAFAAAGAVAAALVIGLGFTTIFFLKEREAHRRAVAAEEQQEHLRADAELARKNAESAEHRELELRQQADAMRRQAEIRQMITQANLFVSKNQFDDADRLADLIPLDESTLEAALVFRSLGDWQATNHNWKAAAARLNSLLKVNETDSRDVVSRDYLRAGTVLAESGDLSGYENFRRRAIAKFANAKNPVFAERILRICLLEPANDEVLGTLEPLAQQLMPTREAANGFQASADLKSGGDASEDSASAATNSPARSSSTSNGASMGATAAESAQLVGAYCYDGISVGIEFSKPPEPVGASDPGNYEITGTAVTKVELKPDGKSAVLWLASPIDSEFTVTLKNTHTAEASSIGGRVVVLHLQDFNTKKPFSANYDGNLITIEAGGADIWQNRDQFIYAYTTVSGDFDYRLRIHSVAPGLDSYTRVGLMARDSLNDPSCREVTIGVNSTNTFQVLVRAMAGGGTASQPPNPLPAAYHSNSWVRLQRTGSVFHTYSSSNGTDWTQIYQFDGLAGPEGPFADPIYLGIATCAHSTDAQTTALVSDLGTTITVPVRVMADLALMEYRRGHFAKASEWCRRCLADPDYDAPRNATIRITLAMACQKLGQTEPARSELDQGRKEIERRFNASPDPSAGAQSGWYDWVFAQVLMTEAVGLITDGPR
jgi:eukaryotic-like serine/threonine-protein kinase